VKPSAALAPPSVDPMTRARVLVRQIRQKLLLVASEERSVARVWSFPSSQGIFILPVMANFTSPSTNSAAVPGSGTGSP